MHDPNVDPDDAKHEFGLNLTDWNNVPECSVAILAVPHGIFKDMGLKVISQKIKAGGCFIDIKSTFDRQQVSELASYSWRL